MKKVTIITGKIATGKTQIAIEKSIECIKQSKKVVYLTFEDRKENIQKWFVAKYVNKYPEELTKEDIENMFRRACFNVFAHNRDDHSKKLYIYPIQSYNKDIRNCRPN